MRSANLASLGCVLFLSIGAPLAACSSAGSGAESVTGSSTAAEAGEGGDAGSPQDGSTDGADGSVSAEAAAGDGSADADGAAIADGGDGAVGDGSSEAASPESPLVGEYACTAATAVDLTSPPIGNYPQPNEPTTLAIVETGATLKATVTPMVDGGTPCTLLFTQGATAVVLEPGQSCTVDTTAIASFTTSTESLTGKQLTVSLPFKLGGTQLGFTLVGTGTETLTCTKQ